MAFENLKNNSNEIQENAKDYLETSLSYYKLLGFKVAMKSTTLLFKFFLVFFCFLLVLLFSSIALAFYLANYFNSYTIGFLCVAGFYFVLAFLLFFVKFKILESVILEKFSEIFFNN